MYHRVLNAARPAIKIKTGNSQTINLCVDSERDLWYMLLNELCSAIYLAKEYRDPTIVQYAARNGILLNVVFASGQDARTKHSQNLDKAAEALIYYTTLRDDETRRSSKYTSQTLNLRINPSSREFERLRYYTLLKRNFQII